LNELPPVKAAANILKQYQYEYKDYLSAGLILCGWDKINGSQVYSIGMGGTVSRQEIVIGGSGSAFIYGYCDVHFKSKMSRQECRDFIVKSLSLAMFRDNSSGGIVRLVDINKDGYQREVVRHSQIFNPLEA
jgi:20S proteasome subunit beta 1